MSEKPKRKFKMFDAILAVICVVFVAEAAAPVASIGNSQYFWWVFLIIAFLLPYGLIAAELGTTYDDEGGLYDWVRRAFGKKWGARCAWYYWINFPLWMASLAVMFPQVIGTITGTEINTFAAIIIELIFIWIVIFLSFSKVSDSTWILNLSAVIKVFLALLIGGLGIYGAINHGVANEYTVQSLLPSFDIKSLGYIAVIIFNFMGFEVVTSFAGDMENPKKQIPQAIIAGGLAIAAIYLFSSFGIGSAIPSDEITANGLVESVQQLVGSPTGILITLTGILFLITLFGNMVSWSFGVNYVAMYAAKNNDLPQVFARQNEKTEMPNGASVMNGIIASILVVLAPLIPNEDLFWSFFALNIIMLLMSYIPLFPAFLKLRSIDPDTERPFRVGGGKVKLALITFVPMILLVLSIILCCVPLSTEPAELAEKIPLIAGVIIAILVGEIITYTCNKKSESKGGVL